jgi:lipoprotein signal peptidase
MQTQPETSPLQSWLRRLWPVYCLFVALAVFGYTRFDPYQIDGDAVSYMDIGDLIRSHQWAGIVNGYWHPLYPAALALGHSLFHSTRFNELHAYYMVNFGIFLLEMLAIVAFTDAVIRLRDRRATIIGDKQPAPFLLTHYPLRYIGLALLVIASQRELSIGKVRPDALLQALLLLGFSGLLTWLATDRLRYTALAGISFGLAFLTKSFAFPVTLICVALLVGFAWLWQRRKPARIALAGVLVLICFGAVAGPYIAALSKQKGRLDFGDSGSLNYAWFVGGTEKMHLQNGTPAIYGTSEVHLYHPEKILLSSPVVASYKEFPYGTYPPWFDATYWNDRIKTHINPRAEVRTIVRDGVLIVRYLINHPEGWLLFLVLVLIGARPDLCRRLSGNGFWVTPLLLGIAILAVYSLVNIEERYVTVGWLAIILTLFISLRAPRDSQRRAEVYAASSALILLLALLAVGESVRRVAEMRRNLLVSEYSAGWQKTEIFNAAHAINQLGVGHGDAIACIGTNACLYDIYWARVADVRILTEIYLPKPFPYTSLASTPNMAKAIDLARADGARLLVGYFDPTVMKGTDPTTSGWISLGNTDYYALALNPSPQNSPAALP